MIHIEFVRVSAAITISHIGVIHQNSNELMKCCDVQEQMEVLSRIKVKLER